MTSFPLYTEALKFAQHGEKMIQTAVRALTLNIFNGIELLYFCVLLRIEKIHENLDIRYIFGILQQYPFGYAVSDDMVYQFVATPPASNYFSDLVHSLREKCILLDGLVKATEYAAFNLL